MSARPSRRHEFVYRAALAAAGTLAGVAMIAAAEGTLRTLDPELMVRNRGLQRYHPALGWENRPGVRFISGGIEVSMDEQGHRVYAPSEGNGTLGARLLILGDSIAFGLGVSDDATFAASLSQGAAPFQVTNAAVPGYGPDQTLLRYESLGDLPPTSVVVFALCLGNDVADVVSLHHLYNADFPKPRFSLRDGDLQLENAHVRGRWRLALSDRSFLLAGLSTSANQRVEGPDEVGRRLEALRAFSPEAEDTLVAIVSRMGLLAEKRGARFVVAAFPDLRTLDPSSMRWPRLREKLERRLEVVDLAPLLARDQEVYARNTLDHIGHLSRRGHEQAARRLRDYLASDRVTASTRVDKPLL